MNKFDQIFFSRYISKGTKILTIIHKHILVVLDKLIINYFFGVIVPSFLYYYSDTVKSYIPFFILEVFLLLMFIKGLYDVFNWYNDVWIVTDDGVIDLDWQIFQSNSVTVKYSGIEGLEFIEKGIIDSILGKGDIVIHKVGGGNKFLLENAVNALKNIEIIDKKLKETKKKHSILNKEPIDNNFETILKALSGVVEGYLEDSGYKKDDSEERKNLINEVKRKGGAIDLNK